MLIIIWLVFISPCLWVTCARPPDGAIVVETPAKGRGSEKGLTRTTYYT